MEEPNPYQPPVAYAEPPRRPPGSWKRTLLAVVLILLSVPSTFLAGGITCFVTAAIIQPSPMPSEGALLIGFIVSLLPMAGIMWMFKYLIKKVNQDAPPEPPRPVESTQDDESSK